MTASSRRNTLSARVSVYDNNESIQSIRKEKYTLVKNPLRTKMSTLSSNGQNSRSFFGHPASANINDPEKMLKDLKQMQKDKLEERRLISNEGRRGHNKNESSLPSIKK